jgi:hypothetical protein
VSAASIGLIVTADSPARNVLAEFDDSGETHIQSRGDPKETSKARVSLASLDPADVVPMEAADVRELLLRQPPVGSNLPDGCA